MTPADLDRWRRQMGSSVSGVCRRLGISRTTWYAYANGDVAIPKVFELACEAIAMRDGQPPQPQPDDDGPVVLAAPFTGPHSPAL